MALIFVAHLSYILEFLGNKTIDIKLITSQRFLVSWQNQCKALEKVKYGKIQSKK